MHMFVSSCVDKNSPAAQTAAHIPMLIGSVTDVVKAAHKLNILESYHSSLTLTGRTFKVSSLSLAQIIQNDQKVKGLNYRMVIQTGGLNSKELPF